MHTHHQFFSNILSLKTSLFAFTMFKFVALVASIAAVCAFASGYESPEGHAQINRQQSELYPDGSYRYAYDTSNGIAVQEKGVGGQAAVGGFAYISPEGIPISVTYSADKYGFHPQGDHLPTPPPIPEAILRSIEWNAAHPEEEEHSYKKLLKHY